MNPPSWQVVVFCLGVIAGLVALVIFAGLSVNYALPVITGLVGWLAPNTLKS